MESIQHIDDSTVLRALHTLVHSQRELINAILSNQGTLMTAISDVNAQVDKLEASFNTLTAAARNVYLALTAASASGGATSAELDTLIARLTTDTATEDGALATITAPPVTPAAPAA